MSLSREDLVVEIQDLRTALKVKNEALDAAFLKESEMQKEIDSLKDKNTSLRNNLMDAIIDGIFEEA